MPPEHAITPFPGVPGLISLSCGAHLLLPLDMFRGGHGVDLEFFLLPPSPVDSIAEPRRGCYRDGFARDSASSGEVSGERDHHTS